MRTTLTLDEDVAAALLRRRAARGTPLRDEVNELLRAGLATVEQAEDREVDAYEPPTFDPGRALITDHAAMRELLDDEDVERAVGRR
jgi:plasmid stability protein